MRFNMCHVQRVTKDEHYVHEIGGTGCSGKVGTVTFSVNMNASNGESSDACHGVRFCCFPHAHAVFMHLCHQCHAQQVLVGEHIVLLNVPSLGGKFSISSMSRNREYDRPNTAELHYLVHFMSQSRPNIAFIASSLSISIELRSPISSRSLE